MDAAETETAREVKIRDLALASMARDDPRKQHGEQHGQRAACSTAAAMRGKVGSEFET